MPDLPLTGPDGHALACSDRSRLGIDLQNATISPDAVIAGR